MSTATVSVALDVPDRARCEEIYREEVRQLVAARGAWMTLDEAAEYCRMPRRTFDRIRGQLKLPTAKLTECTKLVWRADLDVMLAARVVASSNTIVEYSSVKMREQALASLQRKNEPQLLQGAAA